MYNLYYLHSFYYHDYKVLINDCLISRFYTSLLLGCKFCFNDVFNAWRIFLQSVCISVCAYVWAWASLYTHMHNVYMCLSQKALFLGVCWVGVFDFKAQQLKPKTWEKLTKHTDCRWLMGWEKWPVDQHHRWPHSDVPSSVADPHLLDINSYKTLLFVQYMSRMGGPEITRHGALMSSCWMTLYLVIS